MTDFVYRERAHLLAHLATFYPAHLQADEDEPDWPVLCLQLPTGQAMWHISDADLDLFEGVRTDKLIPWDGHSTEEKYRRLHELTRLRQFLTA